MDLNEWAQNNASIGYTRAVVVTNRRVARLIRYESETRNGHSVLRVDALSKQLYAEQSFPSANTLRMDEHSGRIVLPSPAGGLGMTVTDFALVFERSR